MPVWIPIHWRRNEPFQLQKRSIELIRWVKVYYHLIWQENADKSGDIENKTSIELITAKPVWIPIHWRRNEQFQLQKPFMELIRWVKV